jgi:NADP-dependent 3-hydroxy acid dehydrogenase YdfG
MEHSEQPVAVVTGASSGIGAATARRLAAAGFQVVAGARRTERLEALAAETGARAHQLDVTDAGSVAAFAAAVEAGGRCDVLVNNAGLASGLEPVAEADEDRWRLMYETNVVGLLRVTKALLPLLRAAPAGHVVNLGSIAAFEVYRGGAGYSASKHAVRAVTANLRLELNGEPVRVTEIDPGMTETEFSLVRFDGDGARAAGVYDGVEPLSADDVAECVVFAVTRPAHVDIDLLVVRPVAQANALVVSRRR